MLDNVARIDYNPEMEKRDPQEAKLATAIAALLDAKFPGRGGRNRAAEAMDIEPSSLSRYLASRLPPIRKLSPLLAKVGIKLADLMADTLPAPPPIPAPEPLPFRVPLCGIVAAGLGEDEEFPPDQWLDVPIECRGANAAYQVRGLSMREVGILDGDYLFVRTNPEPDHGAIVVAWLQDRGNVVKRLERKGKKCVLHSEDGLVSPRWPYIMTEADKFWGQLIATFRRYQVKPKPAATPKPKKK
jgi:SOS-response transcriptional repressor LexA